MPVIAQKKKTSSLGNVLAAAKKLTTEDKQILKMRLFGDDAIKELKAFESRLKKEHKNIARKTDAEIVDIVKKVRTRNGRI